MEALIEIIIDGIKKFGGEIIAGILLAIALGLFPGLRKLIRKKNNSGEEMQKLIEIQHAIETAQVSHKERSRQDSLNDLDRIRQEARKVREAIQKSKGKQLTADTSIDAETYFKQGGEYYRAKKYVEAMKCYRAAAEKGYAEAQFHLGMMYFNGEGVSRNYEESDYWYRKAIATYRKNAMQGDVKAQIRLGEIYTDDVGVRADKAEAVKWYSMAAEQGDVFWAQYALKGLKEINEVGGKLFK